MSVPRISGDNPRVHILASAQNRVPRIRGDKRVLFTDWFLLKRIPRVSGDEPGGSTCVVVVPRRRGVKIFVPASLYIFPRAGENHPRFNGLTQAFIDVPCVSGDRLQQVVCLKSASQNSPREQG